MLARASWSPARRSSDSATGRRRCGRSGTRSYWRKLEIESKHCRGGADPVRVDCLSSRPAEEARRRSTDGQAHQGTSLPEGGGTVREEEVPESAHVLLLHLRELPERSPGAPRPAARGRLVLCPERCGEPRRGAVQVPRLHQPLPRQRPRRLRHAADRHGVVPADGAPRPRSDEDDRGAREVRRDAARLSEQQAAAGGRNAAAGRPRPPGQARAPRGPLLHEAARQQRGHPAPERHRGTLSELQGQGRRLLRPRHVARRDGPQGGGAALLRARRERVPEKRVRRARQAQARFAEDRMRLASALVAVVLLAGCASGRKDADELRPVPIPRAEQEAVNPTPTMSEARVAEVQTQLTELLERLDVLNARIAKLESPTPTPAPAPAPAQGQARVPVLHTETPSTKLADLAD